VTNARVAVALVRKGFVDFMPVIGGVLWSLSDTGELGDINLEAEIIF
jgi:hypothetical protein